MHRSRAEGGQILPMVALLMVVIIGMAAFAIDGSNLYSQHRRLQADLDVAVRVAAAQLYSHDPASASYDATVTAAMTSAAQLLVQDGYPNTLTGMTSADLQPNPGGTGVCSPRDTTAGIWFCTPPDTSSSPFHGNTAYLEGHMSRDIVGVFGSVLGLGKLHVSVRAVAGQGGHVQPYAMIGLDPANCSIDVQDPATTVIITGSVVADGYSCRHQNATPTITGNVGAVNAGVAPGAPGSRVQFQGQQGLTVVSPVPDPFTPISITTTAPAISVCASGCTYTDFTGDRLEACSSSFYTQYGIDKSAPQPTATYYFPPDSGSTPALITPPVSGNGAFYFLPHCDGSPGVYYATASPCGSTDLSLPGSPTVTSFNSVLVLNDCNTLLFDRGQAALSLNAPTSGPYQGIAISAHTTDPEPPCANGIQTFELRGKATNTINGVIDVPCANVNLGGTSGSITVNGAIVGYSIDTQGQGTVTVNYDPSNTPATHGSVLVE